MAISGRRSLLAVTLLVLCWVLFFPSNAHAKDYSFPKVDITINVSPDGSFDFTEQRTYRFDGSFSWADYKLYTDKCRDVTGFSVKENDKVYIDENLSTQPSGEFTKGGSLVYGKWMYSATNEQRTFTIHYKVIGAIKVYDDVAELYWKFLGGDSEKGVDDVSVTVNLPAGATEEQIKVWGHGPLNGEVRKNGGQQVIYRVTGLPAKTFVEGRIAMPPGIFSNISYLDRVGGKRLEQILKEEEVWANEANNKRMIAKLFLFAAGASIFLGWLLWAYLFRNYGKEHETQFDGDYYRELPGEYSPALVGYLMSFGQVSGTEMVGTIMDLARRGFIKIVEQKKVEQGIFRTKEKFEYVFQKISTAKESELTNQEASLMMLLFDVVGFENVVTIDMLQDFAKNKPKEFMSNYNGWVNAVKSEADRLGFIEKESRTALGINIFFSVVIIGLGIALIAYMANPFGVFVIISGILQMIMSVPLRRRSKTAGEDFQKWRAFKNFLTDFSNMNIALPSSMIIWEHYLVYAVVLGVAEKVIEQLKVALPHLQDETGQRAYMGPSWFQSSRGVSGMNGLASLSSLSASMNSMVTAANSAMSSASGGGGGFSGGGGGGGGGGGAGAG